MATLYNEDVHSEAAKVRANNQLPRVPGDRYLTPKRSDAKKERNEKNPTNWILSMGKSGLFKNRDPYKWIRLIIPIITAVSMSSPKKNLTNQGDYPRVFKETQVFIASF